MPRAVSQNSQTFKMTSLPGGSGERARLGGRGTRPRVPLGGTEFTRRLVFPGAQVFGARARRTTAGAAVLPGIQLHGYGFAENSSSGKP